MIFCSVNSLHAFIYVYPCIYLYILLMKEFTFNIYYWTVVIILVLTVVLCLQVEKKKYMYSLYFSLLFCYKIWRYLSGKLKNWNSRKLYQLTFSEELSVWQEEENCMFQHSRKKDNVMVISFLYQNGEKCSCYGIT